MQNSDDFGFDLLMNPKKKHSIGSDSISISSKGSFVQKKHYDNDVESVKSIDINSHFVDVKQHIPSVASEEESDISYDESDDMSDFIKQKPKQSRQSNNNFKVDSEDYESDNSSIVYGRKGAMREEDIIREKQELLYQFDRLEKKGIKLPRKFNMSSNLEDMKAEYARLKKDKDVDAGVRFQRRMLMAFASGVEFLNERFDPFDIKLSGWSEKIHDDIDDYDEIFEELYDKYKGKANVAPELKLLFMMG